MILFEVIYNISAFSLIGKEKVWMSIANTFNIKVWLEETRRKAAIAIYGERSSALRWVVANKEEAGMHVIPLHKINYQVYFYLHILCDFEKIASLFFSNFLDASGIPQGLQ